MKKLLAILLVLAFVGVAYAQDAAPAVKFSGYADTGIMYKMVGSDDPTLSLFGDDSGQTSRINLVASYTNENVGLVLRYRVQGDISGNLNAYLNRGYVWANLFNDMLKVNAGKLADYSWASFGNDIGNIDTKTGVQLQFKPVAGLNFGVFVPAVGATTTEGAITLYWDGAAIVAGDVGYDADLGHIVLARAASTSTSTLAEDAFKDLLFGGEYAVEGIGAFRAGFNMNPADDTNMAWFSADITAVENFEFLLDYQMDLIGNKDAGYNYFFEEVDYTMDALNAGIDLEQVLFGNSDLPLFLSFGPYAEYTLDALVLGGEFTYYMSTETDFIDSMNGMFIHPYAKYTVGPKAVVEFGAKINNGDLSGTTEEDVLADDTTKVYVDFTWSF